MRVEIRVQIMNPAIHLVSIITLTIYYFMNFILHLSYSCNSARISTTTEQFTFNDHLLASHCSKLFTCVISFKFSFLMQALFSSPFNRWEILKHRTVSNSGIEHLVTILCCLPNPAQSEELHFIPFKFNASVSKVQNVSSPSKRVVEYFPNDVFSLRTKQKHRECGKYQFGVGGEQK